MAGRLERFNHFNKAFENELGLHKTYVKAYEAVEEKFKEKVGFNQYSSYDSFDRVRRRVMKGK